MPNEKKGFSILEPYGHNTPTSKLERYWNNFNGAYSLQRERVAKYSVYSGMSYYPLEFKIKQFELTDEIPSNTWINKSFFNFIRTEFSEKEDNTLNFPRSWPIKIDEIIEAPSSFLDDFLLKNEWQNRIDIELPENDTPEEISDKLFDLLCNSKIGSLKNKENNSRGDFLKRVIPTIKNKSRLLFVLLGFPFKDQNRFRVPFDASIPDMGEITFLIRLYNLTQAMYQVHPYGVDIVILTDGELYRNIFNISEKEVVAYQQRLLMYRNSLNLQGTISFLPLDELLKRSDKNLQVTNLSNYIKNNIKDILREDDDEFNKTFQILVSAIKWNMNSRSYLDDLSDEECWEIVRSNRDKINEEYLKIWDDFNDRAVESALEYVTVNLVLKWHNIIYKFFPDAIRGTVHPKPNQFSLTNSSNSFSWNGVATVKKWPINIDDIRVMPYMALEKETILKQVIHKDTKLPLFYMIGDIHRNIDIAKNILDKTGWKWDNIHGREFKLADISDFINLGLNDEYFSWERKVQTEEYFKDLFQFRLNHYTTYGFGIHGLWLNNKLIGQFGLQVLNNEKDKVEVIIFLGKEYAKKGFGRKLSNYILKECSVYGITELYATVRLDNKVTINMLTKLGFKREKTVIYFNQESIQYKLLLTKGKQ